MKKSKNKRCISLNDAGGNDVYTIFLPHVLCILLFSMVATNAQPSQQESQHVQTKNDVVQPVTNSLEAQGDWRLLHWVDVGGKVHTHIKGNYPAAKFKVTLREQHINFSGGCNNHFGKLQWQDGGQMNIAPLASTRRGCPKNEAMQSDAQLAAWLTRAKMYSVTGMQLIMHLSTGEKLVWQRIGNAGEEAGGVNVRPAVGNGFKRIQPLRQGHAQRAFIKVIVGHNGDIRWSRVMLDPKTSVLREPNTYRDDPMPSIHGFLPQPGNVYVVRIKVQASQQRGRPKWIKDMLVEQSRLDDSDL